jgi:hypothetical protein
MWGFSKQKKKKTFLKEQKFCEGKLENLLGYFIFEMKSSK